MTESSVSAYRHHTAQPSVKPGAIAIAYAGLHKASPDCDEQTVTALRPVDIELDDLRLMPTADLQRLAMRVRLAQIEREVKAPGVPGRFSRIMVDMGAGHRVPAPVAAIMRQAAEDGQITIKDIFTQQRGRTFSYPRQRGMASCRAIMRPDGTHAYSFPEIGRWFRRDHSTVIHAWNTVTPSEYILL